MNDTHGQNTRDNIEAVLRLCARPGPVLILMQDTPDPDALASAQALRELLQVRLKKRAAIRYGGTCGCAENRAMIEILRIGARRVTEGQLGRYRTICLVDSQPHCGNNLLHPGRTADVVIDHHIPARHRTWAATVTDIRPDYGAATTILYEYLRTAGIQITTPLATAMFYGLQSDTQDLGREVGPADVRAYQELFFLADKRKLSRIRHAPVSVDYFKMLVSSIADCLVAGRTVISCIRVCRNVDMMAEVAERMLRLEGIRTSVCYGVCGDLILLSAHALDARSNMAKRMKRVVRKLGTGGGHATMAGGQIPIEGDAEKRLNLVRDRILKVFAPRKNPVPLLEIETSNDGKSNSMLVAGAPASSLQCGSRVSSRLSLK